jgi:glycogen operon protein
MRNPKVPSSAVSDKKAGKLDVREVQINKNKNSKLDQATEILGHDEVRSGVPLPLGIHEFDGGANFSFFSRHASYVRLELFNYASDAIPSRTIELDPANNHTGDIWHVWVNGIKSGQLYAYRVGGPYEPGAGHFLTLISYF